MISGNKNSALFRNILNDLAYCPIGRLHIINNRDEKSEKRTEPSLALPIFQRSSIVIVFVAPSQPTSAPRDSAANLKGTIVLPPEITAGL